MKLRIPNSEFRISCGSAAEDDSPFAIRNSQFHRAFTLIEIMVVVAIIGLVLAMGVPSLLMAVRKEGMRKGVSDVMDACSEARARAIYQGKPTELVLYPQERRWEIANVPSDEDQTFVEDSADGSDNTNSALVPTEHSPWAAAASGTLPDGVEFGLVDINLDDYSESSKAWVRFFPNGTCDEARLVLISAGDKQMISLEFATALATASEVTR
jgi:type IV fimbrial biogenesis protein FimT